MERRNLGMFFLKTYEPLIIRIISSSRKRLRGINKYYGLDINQGKTKMITFASDYFETNI